MKEAKPKKQTGFRRGFLLAASKEPKDKTTRVSVKPIPTGSKHKRVVASSSALLDLEETPKPNATFLMVDDSSRSEDLVGASAADKARMPSFSILESSVETDDDDDGIGLMEVSTTQRQSLITEIPDRDAPVAFSSLVFSGEGRRSLEEEEPKRPSVTPSSAVKEVHLIEEVEPTVVGAQAEISSGDFDTLNQDIARILWRLGKAKCRWRPIADEFVNGSSLRTEKDWNIVWGSLLDSISSSQQARTPELRLSVVLLEKRCSALLPFLRPVDRPSRLRAMGALSVVNYWMDTSSDMYDEHLASLLRMVPVVSDMALGPPRDRTVLAQQSLDTVFRITDTACSAVSRGLKENIGSLACSVWAQAPVLNQLWTLQTKWIQQSQSQREKCTQGSSIGSTDVRSECKLTVLADWGRVFAQCQELSERLARDSTVADETRNTRLGKLWCMSVGGATNDTLDSTIGNLRQTLCKSERGRLTVGHIAACLERELVMMPRSVSVDSKETDSNWGGTQRSILRGVVAWLGQRDSHREGLLQQMRPEVVSILSSETFHSESPECNELVHIISKAVA